MNLVELFCDVDDFFQEFVLSWHQQLLSSGSRKQIRGCQLSESEIITIVVSFHQSHFRNLKSYYLEYVCSHLHTEFPQLVSYNRFVELQQSILIPLCAYLQTRKRASQGIAFIDSTSLAVCHNRRIQRHKTFAGLAQRGKSTMGWFYGFKLHIAVNDSGQLLAFHVSAGNTDDREPVPILTQGLKGKLFGDKGYISQKLLEQLYSQGLEFFTTVRKNMKPRVMSLFDRILLRKRFLIETINDQLKNISQIEHSRHRSVTNFMVNLLAGLVAYTWQDKKPSLKIDKHLQGQILAI